jgi:cell division protein FtsB
VEVLSLLEKRVSDLVSVVKDLRSQNVELSKENQQLKEKVEALETVILKDKDQLSEEQELTKLVVDGVLKSIDAIVEGEHQQ